MLVQLILVAIFAICEKNDLNRVKFMDILRLLDPLSHHFGAGTEICPTGVRDILNDLLVVIFRDWVLIAARLIWKCDYVVISRPIQLLT